MESVMPLCLILEVTGIPSLPGTMWEGTIQRELEDPGHSWRLPNFLLKV